MQGGKWAIAAVLGGLVVAGLLAVAPGVARAQTPAAPASRPRIGLALGGGSARGLAHIGVLEWLEEHRVPIDLIAGTSMGGLVGGTYASGMSPAELADLMRATDWHEMFAIKAPFDHRTFRRKEDARAFPAQIDFGLKGGFKLPSGLNAGQQVQLMLDRIALPYYDVPSFDDLPTPFRAVAADLRKSEVVVLESGRLAEALRATMAMPGVFTPVTIGDRLLVDGGALDNVPADVVRAAKADVVIAVNVSPDYDAAEAIPAGLFSIMGAALDTMMTAATRRVLEQADVVIDPDLKGLNGLDWRKTDELIARGYAAAEAMAGSLLRYQVDEATYAAWRAARSSRRRSALPVPSAVTVEGGTANEQRVIRRRLEKRYVGQPLSVNRLERDVLSLSGTDRYDVVSYHLDAVPDGAALAVALQPKVYGPPFLLPALDLRNTDSINFAANLRARLAIYDTFNTGAEVRLDVGLGTTQNVALEIFRPLGSSPVFVAPRAYVERQSINAYDGQTLLAEYREQRAGGGVDASVMLGSKSEARIGFDWADVSISRRVGEPSLPEADGPERVASIRWTFDGQDSAVVPSRGAYIKTTLRYYLTTPDLVTTEGRVEGPRDLAQGEAQVSWAQRFGRERLMTQVSGGTSFGKSAGVNQFRLGGPLRLGGYNNDAIYGDNYALVTIGVLHEWFRLPDLLGGGAYIGGWIENGSAFNDWKTAKYYGSISAGFVAETIFGPVFVGGSANFEGGARYYIAFGALGR